MISAPFTTAFTRVRRSLFHSFYAVCTATIGFCIGTTALPAHLQAAHVRLTVAPQQLVLKPGERSTLRLTMIVDAGWHTYGLQPRKDKDGIGPQETEITIEPSSLLTRAGAIQAPKPKQVFDKGFQITVDIFEGTVVFDIPVKAASKAKSGTYKAAVKVYYMVCDDERCLPTTEDSVLVEVKIDPASGAEVSADVVSTQASSLPPPLFSSDSTPDSPSNTTLTSLQAQSTQEQQTTQTQTESQSEIARKRSEGIWSFLWFAMGAGASALLTPCVFPMVPITVSFFAKRAEQKQRDAKPRAVRDSFAYALGIILTFTALGIALSLVFGATGISDFAANPWVNLAVAAIFLGLAFNLFGTFEIPLPIELINKLNAKSNEGTGLASVLLMGLTFSITSFTCTVPFVGAALISASSGEWFYPIIGMLGFSGMFALPFFLLALFPSALTRLPKAGSWMNNVKVVMGFLEVAAAVKFLSNADLVWAWGILSREVFLAIWIACGVMIILYILGVFRFPHDAPVQSVGATRAMMAVVFLSLTVYLVSGLFGGRLGELDAFLPPKEYDALIRDTAYNTAAASSTPLHNNRSLVRLALDHQNWKTSYEEGLQEAQRTGKPVFIDFTGFTCTNCRWMETNIFTLPQVQALMAQTVKVQLYTDRRTEPYISNKKLQLERFGTIELPLYVLLKPDGSVIATKAFTRSHEEFIAFLKRAFSPALPN